MPSCLACVQQYEQHRASHCCMTSHQPFPSALRIALANRVKWSPFPTRRSAFSGPLDTAGEMVPPRRRLTTSTHQSVQNGVFQGEMVPLCTGEMVPVGRVKRSQRRVKRSPLRHATRSQSGSCRFASFYSVVITIPVVGPASPVDPWITAPPTQATTEPSACLNGTKTLLRKNTPYRSSFAPADSRASNTRQ